MNILNSNENKFNLPDNIFNNICINDTNIILYN